MDQRERYEWLCWMQMSSCPLSLDKHRKSPSWDTTPYCKYFLFQEAQTCLGGVGGGSPRQGQDGCWFSAPQLTSYLNERPGESSVQEHILLLFCTKQVSTYNTETEISCIPDAPGQLLGELLENSVSSISGDWMNPSVHIWISVSLPSLPRSCSPLLPTFLSLLFCQWSMLQSSHAYSLS